jgi:hypothetical protein
MLLLQQRTIDEVVVGGPGTDDDAPFSGTYTISLRFSIFLSETSDFGAISSFFIFDRTSVPPASTFASLPKFARIAHASSTVVGL